MRFCALFLVAVACLAADANFNFKAGANFTDLDDFKARTVMTFSSQYGYLWMSSVIKGSVLNKSAGADVVAAGFAAGTVLNKIPPFAFGTYVAGKASLDPTIIGNVINGAGMGEAAGGAVAFAFPGFIEYDKDRKFVSYFDFKSAWSSPEKVNTDNKDVEVYKCTLGNKTNGEVNIYLVSSKVPGFVSFANTPVSPNTLEIILELKGYNYKQAGNHLELIVATATVNATGEGNFTGNATYRKSGDDVVSYVALRSEATIDNKQTEVSISADSSIDVPLALNDKIKEYINATFKVSAEVKFDVSLDYKLVSFPPNAKNIIYDPAIGSGVNIYDAPYTPSSASHLVISVLALVLALFLLF